MKRGLRLLAVVIATWAGASFASHAVGSRGTAKKGTSMDPGPHPFALALHCERTYLAGFPFIVAVEVRNISDNEFELMPFFDLFTVPSPVSFVLRGGGHEWTWRTMSRSRNAEPEGMDFGPDSRWFALQDLSNLHPDIPPGHYQLTATLRFLGEQARSETVAVNIQASSQHDRAIAAKLRVASEEGEASWRTFIEENWSTPDVAGLSDIGRRQLAFYLFLHKAAYGPHPIAALDPEEPRKFGQGVLESQAALIRLEILRAAGRADVDRVEAALLERWPGLAWWVDQIRANAGPLMRLRSGYGVDSEYAPKDKPRPYHSGRRN